MPSHTKDDPGPVEGVAEEEEEGLPNAEWSVGGQTFIIPVEVVEEDGGNRLVFRERPFRDGVKIDSTGGKQKTWKLQCLFSNEAVQFDESGVRKGGTLYPDVLESVLDSFDRQETGDLFVPTRGKRRCRANTYSRVETFEERKSARVSLLYVEDNEDNVDAASVQKRTIKGSGLVVVQKAQFDAQGLGLWDGSISQLLEAMNELQGILNLPQTYRDDILGTAGVLLRNIDKTIEAFSDAGQEARDMLTDPFGARLLRRLYALKDEISGAQYESGTSGRQAKTTGFVMERDGTIFDVASDKRVNQDAQKLIDLNQYRIADPLNIEAGTEVLIFA
jgi:hypothetical protein